MYASSIQRREKILAEVVEHRHVTARDLAVRMSVSEATVRRDLRALADEGRVELVYGGATLRRPSDYSFRSKGERNVEGKRVIGKLAADLINDAEQIFVDSGTTCFEMTPYLKRKRQLSVIVHSTRMAMELDAPGLSVIALGGQYRADRMDTVGPLAISAIDQLRGYVCFIGADAIDMDFGLAAADIESASLIQNAVKNARETIVLVDHTKFNSQSLYKIVGWDKVSRVVTDRSPADAWQSFFESNGVEAICPSCINGVCQNGDCKAGGKPTEINETLSSSE